METTIKNRTIFLIVFLFFILNSYFLIDKVMAQAISLSITPPLFELMIQPGKEIKQTYTISNSGGDTFLTPKIVRFEPADEAGNIDLTDDTAPDWVKYLQDPIHIKNGDNVNFNVLFSPPENTEEIDHFLTLVFESKEPIDLLNQNSSIYKSQIGTNILITVSKDGFPKKSAEIIKFEAPKIVDSLLGEISYIVTLKNNGNSFWKPNGKIYTKNETLKLAPQNIISGTNRKINCIDNENLIDCKLQNKFLIGKIISTLEFSIDDDPKIYTEEIITYAFPFTLLLVLIVVFAIFKAWRKRK